LYLKIIIKRILFNVDIQLDDIICVWLNFKKMNFLKKYFFRDF
jgi:hypothetical protein